MRCGLAFAAFNLVCWPLLPYYGHGLVPAVAAVWNVVAPHDQTLVITETAPRLRWVWEPLGVAGQISFGLLTYNVVLYLTALAALPGIDRAQRLRWLLAGLFGLFLWHVIDLLLGIESQLLTATRPQSYDLGEGLDLWFLAVKFTNNLTALGLRQVVPFLLLGAQWLWWRDESAPDAEASRATVERT